jgi:ketosteroid isomerase-like protein
VLLCMESSTPPRDTAWAMSQENVAIVGEAFAAFDRGDTEAVLRLCDEDIVVTQPPELPGVPAEQHGHRGVLEAFAIWPEQWEDYRIEILRIAGVSADKVIVITRNRGRGRQSGVDVDMEISFVFTVRDARITQMRIFMQEDDALEAAGLRD